MAKSRLDFQTKLEEFLGSRNVYFQPPEGFKIKCPCIVYNLSTKTSVNANNSKYLDHKRYSVTIIDEDPDSKLPDDLYKFEYCYFDRFFTSDNLNHWVFDIYF